MLENKNKEKEKSWKGMCFYFDSLSEFFRLYTAKSNITKFVFL